MRAAGLAVDGHHCILTELPLAVAQIDKAAFHTLRIEMRSKHALLSLMDQLCACAGVCVRVQVCACVWRGGRNHSHTNKAACTRKRRRGLLSLC